MGCRRGRGLVVRETFGELSIETDALSIATRCINCGCVDDAVVRANRFRPSMSTPIIPRRCRMIGKEEVMFSRVTLSVCIDSMNSRC